MQLQRGRSHVGAPTWLLPRSSTIMAAQTWPLKRSRSNVDLPMWLPAPAPRAWRLPRQPHAAGAGGHVGAATLEWLHWSGHDGAATLEWPRWSGHVGVACLRHFTPGPRTGLTIIYYIHIYDTGQGGGGIFCFLCQYVAQSTDLTESSTLI